ncbi:MAG: NAD(P)(+) transhydrogenase (Re/Si-specific) subunit beta, partial [Steroidobacteraceae bacterium]
MTGFFSPEVAKGLVDASYLLTAFLFIMGLKRMSSPVTAKSGIVWAGWGMLVATLVTFIDPQITANYILIVTAIFLGGILAWWTGKRVAVTDMPQMIALYNGMGGGAAAAIAAVELLGGEAHSKAAISLAVIGAIIGTVSFSGSMIAFGKLQGLINKSFRFKGQKLVNGLLLLAVLVNGLLIVLTGLGYVTLSIEAMALIAIFFALALVLGVAMTLPI